MLFLKGYIMGEDKKLLANGLDQFSEIALLSRAFGRIYIPHSELSASLTGGAVVAIGGSKLTGLSYDAAGVEEADINFEAPDILNGAFPVNVFLKWTAPATSGNVVWDMDYKSIAEGEDLGGAEVNVTVTDAAPGTADFKLTSPVLVIPAGVITQGDTISLNFRREGGDGGDTMTGDAVLIGVELQFTTRPEIEQGL